MIGTATITCVEISGGVIIAAKINTITNAYLRFFLRNSGVTSPILVRKYMIIGSSNIKPEASTEALTSPINESMSNSF